MMPTKTIQERFNISANDKIHLDKLMASFGLTSSDYFRICVKQAIKYHGIPFKLQNRPALNNPATWDENVIKRGLAYINNHSKVLTKKAAAKKIGL